MRLRSILKGLLAGVLLLALVAPAQAEPEKNGEAESLQKWYDGLTPEKREQLRKRAEALRNMPKDQHEAVIKGLKGDREIFTPEQKERLKKLAGMSDIQRARLHFLRNDLEQLQKRMPDFVKGLENMSREERARTFGRKLWQSRNERFERTLPEDKRKELRGLPEGERAKRLREWQARAFNARVDELAKTRAEVAELKHKADAGDREAKQELGRMLRDLGTLERLMAGLEAGERDKLREKIAGLPLDKAVATVREAMREHWKKHPPKREPRERDTKDSADTPRHRGPREDFRRK